MTMRGRLDLYYNITIMKTSQWSWVSVSVSNSEWQPLEPKEEEND